jgi:signal transduction histidine kinase
MLALSKPAAALRRLAGATPSSHPPRRAVRLRLTALYGCLFLASGAGLLAITNLLVARQATTTAFYISRANGPAQLHIQGVVGGFSAPVGLPPPVVAARTLAAPSKAGKRSGGSVRTSAAPSKAGKGSGGSSASATVAVGPGASLPTAGDPLAAGNRTVRATPQQLRAQARQLTTLASKQRSAEHDVLLTISAIALAIMAVISVALGWLISGRALRPLDEAFEAQRRFVSNASHELRTPLAMMRTSLDVAVAKPGPHSPRLDALERKLREGLDHADRLVESFLTLARAQRGAPPEQGPVSLTRLLRAAIAGHARAAAERDIEIHAAIGEDIRINGSETLLRRMLDNVIGNAIRHNQRGGWVRVATQTTDDRRRGPGIGRSSRILVENSGPHLREEDVAQLAQPFRRPGAERTGSQDGHGLGLSIVSAIAAAHGGRLELAARAEGGLRVCIDLPPSRASSRSGAQTASSGQLPAGGAS